MAFASIVVLLLYLNYTLGHQVNCSKEEIFVSKNLTFLGGVVEQITNITWGSEHFGQHLECVSGMTTKKT